MLYSGQCHCGKLKASFETQKTPQELGVRTCQCAFCRRHGAVNISDPDGRVTIDAAEEDVVRYVFGLRTCDFLLCRWCGVYVAAVIGREDEKHATINVAGLRMTDFLGIDESPMEYGEETTEERTARRFRKWTPVSFTDRALDDGNFGPH